METVNTELIRGHVDTIILRSLETTDRYGYEILDIIEDLTDGRYLIKQPTLYSCLKRLEKQGFIDSYLGAESNGGQRRYYKLTSKGKLTLFQDQKEWEFSRSIMDKLLSDKKIDLKTVEAPFDPSSLRPLTKRVKAYDDIDFERASEESIKGAIVCDPNKAQVDFMTINNKIEEKSYQNTETSFVPDKVVGQSSSFSSQILSETKFPIKREEEEYAQEQITAQRDAASKLLRLGNYANEIDAEELFKQTAAAVAPTHMSNIDEDINKSSLNYKNVLSPLFKQSQDKMITSQEQEFKDSELINMAHPKHFNDLTNSLSTEGFTVRGYNKSKVSDHYYLNYFYSNKILRDTLLLGYLLLVAMMLGCLLLNQYIKFSLSTYGIMAAVALLLPIISIIIYAANPNKKVKANFNFGGTFINSLSAFIIVAALSMVYYMVSPSLKIGFDDLRMYIPLIFSTSMPIIVIIYNLLYKSKRYHIKKDI